MVHVNHFRGFQAIQEPDQYADCKSPIESAQISVFPCKSAVFELPNIGGLWYYTAWKCLTNGGKYDGHENTL